MPDANERITLTSTGIQVDGVTLPGTFDAIAIVTEVPDTNPPVYGVALGLITRHKPVIGHGLDHDPETGVVMRARPS